MAGTLIMSKVQKEGQVTIPIEMREKLGLKEGDVVAFLEIGSSILISPQESITMGLLDQLGQSLTDAGISLDEIIESGRVIRGDLMEEKFGVTESQW